MIFPKLGPIGKLSSKCAEVATGHLAHGSDNQAGVGPRYRFLLYYNFFGYFTHLYESYEVVEVVMNYRGPKKTFCIRPGSPRSDGTSKYY